MVENGGNVSKAMEQAGYSSATAKTPQKLTDSEGFVIALEEEMPDSLLLSEHKKVLLQNTDLTNKMKAIVEGYKLKKKYPTEVPTGTNITFNMLVLPELTE